MKQHEDYIEPLLIVFWRMELSNAEKDWKHSPRLTSAEN